MNPLMFFDSKVYEVPQQFMEGLYKVLGAMGLTSNKNVELLGYQLKHVS